MLSPRILEYWKLIQTRCTFDRNLKRYLGMDAERAHLIASTFTLLQIKKNLTSLVKISLHLKMNLCDE